MGRLTASRSRALKSVLLACAAMAAPMALAAVASPASAQQQAEPLYEFNIPAQTLSRSVAAVAARADIQVLYTDEAPNEVRAPALRGRMTVTEALNRLTAGTGYTYAYTQPGVIRLERIRTTSIGEDGSRVLGPVRVEGAQSSLGDVGSRSRGDGVAQLGGVRGGQDEEAVGYRARVAAVGAGAPMALEDIPRSISVLTAEQIEMQDIRTIGDAIARLPGVTLAESASPSLETGAALYARGFAVTQVQLDGGAPRGLNLISNGLMDLTAYERVELVRGANGAFTGLGSAGGTLNLVRKRPGPVETLELTAGVGSHERYQASLDYSTPSLLNLNFAFRAAMSLEEQGSWFDRTSRASRSFYAVADGPLGDRARIEIGGSFSEVEENAPYSGLLRYADGPLISRMGYFANFTPADAFDDSRQLGFFSRLYLDLNDGMDLEVGFDLDRTEQRAARLGYGFEAVSENERLIYGHVAPYLAERESLNWSWNFRLQGKAETWGLSHAYQVAGDITEGPAGGVRAASYGYFPVASLEELYSFELPAAPTAGFENGVDGTSTRMGLTFLDTISWRDKIDLTLSARRFASRLGGYQVFVNPNGVPRSINVFAADGGSQAEEDWIFNWALAIKPTRNLSLFGTRSQGADEILQPFYTADGAVLPAPTYDNLEVGVKYARDRWLFSLAYYDQRKSGVPESDYSTPCPPSNTLLTPCYFATGADQQSKGVDLELTGEIFPGLSVVASYNYGEIKSRRYGNNFLTAAPSQAGQLFVDWSPGFWPNTSLRGGLRYRSRVYNTGIRTFYDPQTGAYIGSELFEFDEAPYTVFDLGVRHNLSPSLALDVFVENLTDERYLSTVSQGINIPGAPRSIMATLRWNQEGLFNWAPRSGEPLAPFGHPADWYAGVEAGLHGPSDLEGRADGVSQDGVTPVAWTFETAQGFAGLARLGYHVAPRARVEFEASYRASDLGDIGGGASAPFGVCAADQSNAGVPFDCDDAGGQVDNWSVMANGLYDFGASEDRLRPFLGVGVGLARTAVRFSGKMEGVGLDDPWNYDPIRQTQEAIGGDSVKLGLAWQVLAGVSYRISPQATLEATYRYYRAPDLTWDSYNLDQDGDFFGTPVPQLTPRVGSFSSDYEDHALGIGLRWAFGVR